MKMSKFAAWRVILLSGIMVHFFLSQASAEIPRQTERARQIRQQLAMQLEPRVVSPAQLEPYREQLLLAVDALSPASPATGSALAAADSPALP